MNLQIRIILFALLLGLSTLVFSQGGLEDFNLKRQQTSMAGMWTLGGWAAANFVVGGIGWARGSGSNMYFHQGNVLWNTVNAGIAGFALYSLYNADPGSLGLFESIKEHYGLEKTLLFNAGLDVGYMAAGFYLRERAKTATKKQDMLKGYGSALILQGAFLFVFDLALYGIINQQSKQLETLLSSVFLTPEGFGILLRF
jgi:hypothetical protein